MIPWCLFAFGVASSWLAANAARPPRAPGGVALVLFFVAWPTIELALHFVVIEIALGAALVALGGAAAWPGIVGCALVLAACAWLVAIHASGARAKHRFAEALDAALGRDTESAHTRTWLAARVGLWPLVAPFLAHRSGIEVTRRVRFHDQDGLVLKLDVYAPKTRPTKAPASSKASDVPVRPARAPTLVYVHGGGWIVGYRRYQGLPLMRHLASLGWVCFSIDYRLSPRATFPDHLIDVKRGIAWVRAHAAELGADPDFIVIVGNSAGAHLASLAALTPNDPEYQPGFEDADTRVSGCVGFYGVYDFTDRHGHWPHHGFAPFVERTVMKKKRAEHPEHFAKASPIARVHADAPPFLLVHGDRDTLAPTDESRRFAEALRAVSRAPVAYAEVEGAQHAFEIFASPRAKHAIEGTTRFLAWLYAAHLEARAERRAAE